MNLEAIYHRCQLNWAYAYDKETLHIRLRVKKNDATKVILYSGDKYGWNHTNAVADMKKIGSDHLFDYWQGEIKPKYKRTVYFFEIQNEQEVVYLIEEGIVFKKPEIFYKALFDFPFLNAVDVHTPPSWLENTVFYQIFPERFANGDPSNDPEDVLPWGGTPTPTNYFGGDLQGIIDHLDYLTELGINAIYFNPIFQATKNHKYDTTDYFKVDDHFGDNALLKKLVDLCHERGIRVLLDAVFNHSGDSFAPFVDVLKNGKQSKFKDWFHIKEWPLQVKDGIPNYETFAFEPIMPKLNTENEEVKNYLLGVAKYWIEEVGIDGWRLDVANEVDHQFWREFRKVVKEANPDAYILGEIMHDAMPWLQGDQFDAVMNYPFTETVLDFFVHKKITADEFVNKIHALNIKYPQQITESSFNLLGSHDTIRLLTLCSGNKQLLKLAYLFQLTFTGVPCIYYGDEIGLDGEYDPLNRKCMQWDPAKQDLELLAFFKRIIKLRLSYSALRSGQLNFISTSNKDVLVYERNNEDDHFIIALNTASTSTNIQLPTSTNWLDIESNRMTKSKLGQLNITLGAYSYIILKKS